MVKSLADFSFRQNVFMMFFLLSVIVLGSFNVGPLSVRVYMTILMLFYIIINRNKFKCQDIVIISLKFIKLYMLFVAIFFISLCFTGDLIKIGFFKRLLSIDLVCIVTFFAIYLNINSSKQIKCIVAFLLVICFFDSLITIMQMTGNEIGWKVGGFISSYEDVQDIIDSHAGDVNIAIAPGVFGNVVHNAFKLASYAPLVIAFYEKKQKGKIFFLIVNLVFIVAIFLTQQRAAFYFYGFSLAIYLCITFIKKPLVLICFVIFTVLCVNQVEEFFLDFDFGRLLSMRDDARSAMWEYAMDFIPNHFLFGGISAYVSVFGLTSHNIFFDSFIFAGVGGFITLLLFNLKVGFICIKQTFAFLLKKTSLMTFALAMSMTTCTLYGFTHNTSVLTGSVEVFILLGLLLKSIQIDKSK